MINGTRRIRQSPNIWPGYVDALSALLMVVIFVVLIYAVIHFLLSEILFGQENELASLHKRLNQLTVELGLEIEKSMSLEKEISGLSSIVSSLTQERNNLTETVSRMTQVTERDRAEIQEQMMVIASLQEDISTLRELRDDLEARVSGLAASLDGKQEEIGALRNRSAALEAKLSTAAERTQLAQRTIERKEIRIQALAALIGEQKMALKNERTLSSNARAEIILLNQQMDGLKKQLKEIGRALAVAEAVVKEKDTEIKKLGKRLNIALARRVSQLEQYRSEFFGRMRDVLGSHPFIRIEGDRFVFQSELLFDSGSADLGEDGRQHLAELAGILKEIIGKIPNDIHWIFRVDGHTDRIPIHNEAFASNWQLSTARAVSVVRYLASQGIPQRRMAAAGFSQYHPLDTANNSGAYRKNRRIEIKLTSL